MLTAKLCKQMIVSDCHSVNIGTKDPKHESVRNPPHNNFPVKISIDPCCCFLVILFTVRKKYGQGQKQYPPHGYVSAQGNNDEM